MEGRRVALQRGAADAWMATVVAIQDDDKRCLPAWLGASTIAATAGTAPEVAAGGHRARLIDGEIAPAERRVVQLVDGVLRVGVGFHLNEREPTCAARLALTHYSDRCDCARGGEQGLEIGLGGFVREITYIKLATHTQLRHP